MIRARLSECLLARTLRSRFAERTERLTDGRPFSAEPNVVISTENNSIFHEACNSKDAKSSLRVDVFFYLILVLITASCTRLTLI